MPETDLEVLEDFGPAPETGAWPAHRSAIVTICQADRRLRALAVKLRAREANALATHLTATTALSMAPSEHGVIVRAWAGARDLGVLTMLPAVDPTVDALVISKGGPRRPQFWNHELIAFHAVTVRVPQNGGNAAAGWPEASATLLRFVAPLRPQGMPPRIAAEVIRMASTVWAGVVLADHEGREDLLDQAREAVRERGAPEALVDLLVERKRRSFRDDPRLMAVDEVDLEGEELRLSVQATVPKAG